jgi:inorganic pyrophosphatase
VNPSGPPHLTGGRVDPAVWLGVTVTVTVDRPAGSRHPRHGFSYPINYGYLPDVIAADGDGLDSYIVGTTEPIDTATGTVVAVIERHDDIEDKLVVAIDDSRWDAERVGTAVAFCEQFFTTTIHT